MLNNIYLIEQLCFFLKNEIRNYRISEIFSQEKDKLIITLISSDNKCIKNLEFSAIKNLNFLLLKNEFSKAKKNFANLFGEINNKEILKVELYNNDRIISLSLDDGLNILIVLIPAKANILLIKNGIVQNSFKNKDELLHKCVENLFSRNIISESKNAKTSLEYIKHTSPELGKLLIIEIFF